MTSDILNEREHLYRLIIGQLLYDGLNAEAYFLGNTVGIEMSLVPPSPRLLYAMRHQKIDYEAKKKQYSRAHKESLDYGYGAGNAVARTVCLDFDAIVDEITTPPISGYNSQYNTSHKGPVTCAEFSSDGETFNGYRIRRQLHQSIPLFKQSIFMVERLFLKTYDIKADKNTKSKADDVSPQNHPVIRTLYEHTAPISALEFHPTHHVLISGGEDNQIFFYDLNKNAVKKAYKTISVFCRFSVHPSGDYIIVSVAHNIIRLYDINTLCCFATSSIETTHTGIVNSVKYDSNGRMYVSASEDGSFKVRSLLIDMGWRE
ncbi:Cleavage stimulation factor subunit 1 [Thelohanellus kitauei]|uniref:Cleavage stimulation factor 50 kDa subunit n=1 Tax=Thelohanellus kitauei TaxID=669202 RepID=A0A0C2N4J3_THEKT|nr:Cleavage stimulation factor subunit 1 [Thelohanellus kitauei]